MLWVVSRVRQSRIVGGFILDCVSELSELVVAVLVLRTQYFYSDIFLSDNFKHQCCCKGLLHLDHIVFIATRIML